MALETLNGRAVSWAECKVTVNVEGGESIPDIDLKDLDTESKVERGEQKKGGRVVAVTTGEVSNAGSGTIYASGMEALYDVLVRAAIAANFVNDEGQVQVSKVKFNLVVKHDYKDDSAIRTKKLIDCHLDKDAEKYGEGTDASVVEIDFNPRQIIKVVNGRDVVLL